MRFDENSALVAASRLAVALFFAGCVACSSEAPATGPVTTLGACGGRGETVSAGTSKLSTRGYRFELLQLSPAVPVQSAGAPGNQWTVRVLDRDGAPAGGGELLIATSMPDHNHDGQPAAAVETGEETGIYDVTELVFSMPTLFVVTLTFSPRTGERDSVQLMLCMEVASG